MIFSKKQQRRLSLEIQIQKQKINWIPLVCKTEPKELVHGPIELEHRHVLLPQECSQPFVIAQHQSETLSSTEIRCKFKSIKKEINANIDVIIDFFFQYSLIPRF